MSYDFIPNRGGKPIHKDVTYELDQYPEDRTEKDLERHVAPAIRHHMQDFLQAIASRGRPVADIEEGHISTASCILANLSMKLGRSLTWDAKNARSSATTRPTACSVAPTARPGSTRTRSACRDKLNSCHNSKTQDGRRSRSLRITAVTRKH